MIKEAGIDLNEMPSEALDMPFGLILRSRSHFWRNRRRDGSGTAPPRGQQPAGRLGEYQFYRSAGSGRNQGSDGDTGDREVKIAVVNGLRCADEVMRKIQSGELYYDFVEVMACKRGCIIGGGQPVPIGPRTKKARLEGLYKIDTVAQIKLSNQNPIIQTLYGGLLKGKEHKLLHNEK